VPWAVNLDQVSVVDQTEEPVDRLDVLGLRANLDRAALELTATPDQDGRETEAKDATGAHPQADHSRDQSADVAQTLDLPGALVLPGARFRAVTQLAVPQILAAEQSDVTVNQDFHPANLDQAHRAIRQEAPDQVRRESREQLGEMGALG
jgi:hypothetical protein